MIEGIRHIIFDLGGVLLNIDHGLTEEAFTSLGLTNFAQLCSQLQQAALFDDYETGRISTAEFYKGIQDASPIPLTDAQIEASWNAMLLDFPVGRLQILQNLRLRYDLILLSNTNELHEMAFNKILKQAHGMPNIGVFFDKVYLSHRVGARKPDSVIFQRILDENGFKPEHTLFIDDSPQHIKGAESIGIKTIYLEKGMTIEKSIFLPKK